MIEGSKTGESEILGLFLNEVVRSCLVSQGKLKRTRALTAVAQLVKYHYAKHKFESLILLIPSWGTCLHCGQYPVCACGRVHFINVSLALQCFTPSLSLSFPP